MTFTDGIVYVDDFFSSEAIDSLEEENYDLLMTHDEPDFGRKKIEIRCDAVDAELWEFMKSTELAQQIMEVADLSWRLVFNRLLAKENYAAISSYRPGFGMKWHCDHWHGHVINWIVTLESADSYIKWCDEAFPRALPEAFNPTHVPSACDLIPNRLILMPSYYPHTIITDDEEERVSVHGHFKT